MIPHSAFQSVDAVAEHLPFHVSDSARANEVFQCWRAHGRAEDLYVLDLWTYCFTRRYFLVKFVREENHSEADIEALIDKTFQKIERHRSTIVDESRYASWVSVVCRNSYLNYLRGRRKMVSLEASGLPLVAEETVPHDAGLLHQALLAAIARLPEFLQEVARLRFVLGRSYEEISKAVEKEIPTVRSYVNKAVKRFREDRRLLAYLDRLPDGGHNG